MASFKALDHSSRLTDPTGFAQAAKAAGYSAVLRYLPIPPGTLASDVVGRLTAAEVAAYHAAGLGVGVVWETVPHRPLDGAPAGRVDGAAARTAANALGFSPTFPIFGAVDFNPTPDEYPVIADYFRAGNFEPYGNGPLLTYLEGHGLAVHSWMHNWGGSGYGDPHIHQQGGQVTIAGINCDLNDVYYEDCIWWPDSQVHIQSAGPVSSVEEDYMLSFSDDRGTFMCDSSGAVYTFDASGSAVDGGRYLGGLNSHPAWNAGAGLVNGPPFAFGPTPPDNSGRKGYFITTRDPKGNFHPYVFPGDGSLK